MVGWMSRLGHRLEFDEAGRACARSRDAVIARSMNVSMKKMIYDRLTGRETSLAVIGLGYVGVP